MAATVPSTLALAVIADDSSIVAADHRNNYAAAQVGVNGLIAVWTNAQTKGDLNVAAGGGSFDRLPVGANGQVIVADSTQALGMKWANGSYRKVTAKAVNTTTSATDLLNAEITVAANQMGADRRLIVDAFGDWVQNSGGTAAAPRFQLKFGGTTIFDTGAGPTTTASATRGNWSLVAKIQNTAAGAQVATVTFKIYGPGGFAATQSAFTTGEGFYMAPVAALATGYGDGYNTASVDTTASCAVVLNVINGSSSGSYETKLASATVDIA